MQEQLLTSRFLQADHTAPPPRRPSAQRCSLQRSCRAGCKNRKPEITLVINSDVRQLATQHSASHCSFIDTIDNCILCADMHLHNPEFLACSLFAKQYLRRAYSLEVVVSLQKLKRMFQNKKCILIFQLLREKKNVKNL